MRRRRGPHRVGGALLGGAVLGASALLGPLSAAGAASARAVSSQAAKGIALDPAMFATGACMAFAPTSGNRHQTVFLDAGHGGIDPGGVGTTEDGSQIAESQINLPIELASMAILRAHGFRVVVSRTQDTTAARDECANLSKASALVGIYMDAGYESTNAGSIAAYDSDRPFAQSNLALATDLQNAVLWAMDAEGCLWVTRPHAGCLVRVRPDGSIDRTLSLPVSNPTTCAFGGPDLRTLFITSARSSQRLSGSLFAIAMDVPGDPVGRFRCTGPQQVIL